MTRQETPRETILIAGVHMGVMWMLFAIAVAVDPSLQPIGPLSQAVAKSFSDINVVQDDILAAQAEESKEMDRILGPQVPSPAPVVVAVESNAALSPSVPASFLETPEIKDAALTEPVAMDFTDLDNIQKQLGKLHGKMAGELENLRKTTSEDEQSSKEAAEAAAMASSFVQTDDKETTNTDSPSKLMEQLKEMRALFKPIQDRISDPTGVKGPTSFDEKQVFKLNSMNNQVVKHLLHVLQAMHRNDQTAQDHAHQNLEDQLAKVRLQMLDQMEEVAAHKQKRPVKSVAGRVAEDMGTVLAPLKQHLHKLQSEKPEVAKLFEVPEALQDLTGIEQLAKENVANVLDAEARMKLAKTPEEQEQISMDLQKHMTHVDNQITKGLRRTQTISTLQKRKNRMDAVAQTDAFQDRLTAVIADYPQIANHKNVITALTHTGAIQEMGQAYENLHGRLSRIDDDIKKGFDELTPETHEKMLALVRGMEKLQVESDKHSKAIEDLQDPVVDLFWSKALPGEYGEEPKQTPSSFEEGTEDAGMPSRIPSPAPALPMGEAADEVGYAKIENQLAGLQSHLQGQVQSFKAQAQEQAQEQTQQLDALMTPETQPASLAQEHSKATDERFLRTDK